MTALEEIEHKLSLLPEYLRYRAEWLIEEHKRNKELWSMYNDSGFLIYQKRRPHLIPFNTWLNRMNIVGMDDMFVYFENRMGITLASRRIEGW